jgi:hypothetical protein
LAGFGPRVILLGLNPHPFFKIGGAMVSNAMLERYTAASFTREEAKAKIGKTVSLLADYDSFRKGDVGRVVDYHEQSKDVFQVVVKWNSSNGAEPNYDVFGRERYDRLLDEV